MELAGAQCWYLEQSKGAREPGLECVCWPLLCLCRHFAFVRDICIRLRELPAEFVMICVAQITAAVTFSAVSSSRTFVGILRSSASRPRHSPTKKT
jgi:hypothetical protein